MTLVLDASVAVKLVVEETGSDSAARLLEAGEDLIAPDLLLIEVGNVLWRKVRDSQLLEVHAARSLDDVPDFLERLYPSAPLVSDAWRIAFQLRHPIYDCVYLALAERADRAVVTADKELCAKAERGRLGHRVRLLA